MRIISGRLRRRKLLINPGNTTRPITDRVKVMLFDRLDRELPNARVADIFSGTGSYGFEAISRGAGSAVFFEQDRKAFELLLKNQESLELKECSLCWSVDVLRTSFVPKGVDAFLPYTLVFFDPPYSMVEPGMKPGQPLFKAVERLAKPAATAENAVVVYRTERRTDLVIPECWERTHLWQISNMAFHFLEKTDRPKAQEAVETSE